MILREGCPPVPVEHQPILIRLAELMLAWMLEQQALSEGANEKPQEANPAAELLLNEPNASPRL